MKNVIFKLLFKNIGYKLFALVLSVILWSIIQGEQILEDNREIVVHVETPKGFAIRGDTRRVILATIRGPRVLMAEKTPLEARIKVPPLKGNRYRVRLDKEDIKGLDDRLHITIHDPYLVLYVDEEGSRIVPVHWEPQGAPAEGYFLRKKMVTPNEIQIEGLKSDIIKITEIMAEPFDISGIKENKSFSVHLITPEGLSSEKLSHETVYINVEISEITENKSFDGIPIEIQGSEYEATITPKNVAITAQGRPSVLNLLNNKDFQAFIEAEDLKPGIYHQEIKVKLPPETLLIEFVPNKVTLNISRKRLTDGD